MAGLIPSFEWRPFGCCMACRAPFTPGGDFVIDRESVRLMQVNAAIKNYVLTKHVRPPVGFMSEMNMCHAITQAQRASAVAFVLRKLDEERLNRIRPPWFPDTVFEPAWIGRGAPGRTSLYLGLANGQREYRARWDSPDPINTRPLSMLLGRVSQGRPCAPAPVGLTVPCCKNCNDVMDATTSALALLVGPGGRHGLVPSQAVHVQWAGPPIQNMHVPTRRTRAENNAAHGALFAYFHERCAAGRAGTTTPNAAPFSAMAWRDNHAFICHMILMACAHARMRRVSRDRTAGDHTFCGLSTLFLSLALFEIARLDHTLVGGAGLSFSDVHVYFVCEMADVFGLHGWLADWSPVPNDLPTVLCEGPRGVGANASPQGFFEGTLQRVCDFYESAYKYLVGRCCGLERVVPRNVSACDALDEFFVTGRGVALLNRRHESVRVFTQEAGAQDPGAFMRAVGVYPMLWPVRQMFAREAVAVQDIITNMVMAERQDEIKSLGAKVKPRAYGFKRAEVLYLMQSITSIEELTMKFPNDMDPNEDFLSEDEEQMRMRPSNEFELFRRYDMDQLLNFVMDSPMCSVWKMALRLGLKYNALEMAWRPRDRRPAAAAPGAAAAPAPRAPGRPARRG